MRDVDWPTDWVLVVIGVAAVGILVLAIVLGNAQHKRMRGGAECHSDALSLHPAEIKLLSERVARIADLLSQGSATSPTP